MIWPGYNSQYGKPSSNVKGKWRIQRLRVCGHVSLHPFLVCHNSHPFPSFLWNTCHGVRLVKVISAETALIHRVIMWQQIALPHLYYTLPFISCQHCVRFVVVIIYPWFKFLFFFVSKSFTYEHSHGPKQGKIKFISRINSNHNRYISGNIFLTYM